MSTVAIGTNGSFTSDGHIYQSEGQVIPSLTQILCLSGITTDIKLLPESTQYMIRKAGDFGTNVHDACQFLDEDDLDLETLDEYLLPYVVAYQKFKQAIEFEPVLIEHQVIAESDSLKYGMRVDRVGISAKTGEQIILDIKTASNPSKAQKASYGIQTAGYAIGLKEDNSARMAVLLQKDSSYKVLTYKDESDFDVFRAAIKIAYFRLANGAKL